MTEHWNRETVEVLTRRVAELKARIAEHEPVATTLRTLWPVIDGYFDELRRVSAALATAAENADQAPLLAQWNSQMFMLESAFAIVEERLSGQSSARSRIEAFLVSKSAATNAAKAKSERLVRDVESLKSALADIAGRDPDPELVRLLGVLEKRVAGSKESLELLSRALIAVVNRARIVFGADRK